MKPGKMAKKTSQAVKQKLNHFILLIISETYTEAKPVNRSIK